MNRRSELTRKEKRFFNVAKAISKTSDFHGAHIGCAIVYKKNILSVASNSEKTHSLQRQYNRFRNFDIDKSPAKVHSEVHALSWLIGKDIDWSQVELYVYRETQKGCPAISKPCKSCMKLIYDLGIKTIFYINEYGDYVKEKINYI